MKKLCLFLIILFVIFTQTGIADSERQVLIILKGGSESMDLMLTKEVGVMLQMLRDAGFQPIIATEFGTLLKGRSTSLQPNLKLSEVKIEDYVGLIIPCMAWGMYTGISDEAIALTKQAAYKGLPIAAQQGGVEFLEQAGLLKGKHFSISEDYEYIVADGIYDGAGVSQDGKIITSGTCPYRASSILPDGTVELMTKFISIITSVQQIEDH